jgi:hypothetical protein
MIHGSKRAATALGCELNLIDVIFYCALLLHLVFDNVPLDIRIMTVHGLWKQFNKSQGRIRPALIQFPSFFPQISSRQRNRGYHASRSTLQGSFTASIGISHSRTSSLSYFGSRLPEGQLPSLDTNFSEMLFSAFLTMTRNSQP